MMATLEINQVHEVTVTRGARRGTRDDRDTYILRIESMTGGLTDGLTLVLTTKPGADIGLDPLIDYSACDNCSGEGTVEELIDVDDSVVRPCTEPGCPEAGTKVIARKLASDEAEAERCAQESAEERAGPW